MCLFKDKVSHPHNRYLIAEEDIVCYKKLQQIGGAYITPCTDTQVPIECIQDKVPFEATILHKFLFIWRHVFGFGNLVVDGFIHTFQADDGRRSYKVFKCIIPKGTKYFIGKERDYASERIIFLKEIELVTLVIKRYGFESHTASAVSLMVKRYLETVEW